MVGRSVIVFGGDEIVVIVVVAAVVAVSVSVDGP